MRRWPLQRPLSFPCVIASDILRLEFHSLTLPRATCRSRREARFSAKRGIVRCFSQVYAHNAKCITEHKLDDLPQGSLHVKPVKKENGSNSYPTVVRQAQENMAKYSDCVLLTRVGGFYELYFDQAEKYGHLLNLKVARKNTIAGPVPMAGFPFFHLDRYLKMLVHDMNLSVAMSEEFAMDNSSKVKSGGLLFDRRVSRIISAGTLIDEQFMDPYESNYLLAIHIPDTVNRSVESSTDEPRIGLAWTDLSTGSFFTQSCTLKSLPSAIAGISPRETIIDKDLEDLKGAFALPQQILQPIALGPTSNRFMSLESWTSILEHPLAAMTQATFTEEEVAAGSRLLEYSAGHLQGLGLRLQPPLQRQASENMEIDRSTMRALEIKETLAQGTSKGSLLHAVRRTVTKSGSRLLSTRLSSPSADMDTIDRRLDLVSFFVAEADAREQVTSLLQKTSDSQRLVQKFSLGRGDPDDLLYLSRTIYAMDNISMLLVSKVQSLAGSDSNVKSVQSLIERFEKDQPLLLAKKIEETVDEQGVQETHNLEDSEATELSTLASQVLGQSSERLSPGPRAKSKGPRTILSPARDIEDEVWIMKRTSSPTLEKLHREVAKLCDRREMLAENLRIKLGVTSLTLRWTPGLGHICHLKGKDTLVPLSQIEGARSVSSSKSTISFYLPTWTELGREMDQLKLRVRAEEQRVFQGLSREVVLNLVRLRRNAVILDELDVACSSAVLAQAQALVRPVITPNNSSKIIGGRHPTVDVGLREEGRSFTPNDCQLRLDQRIWLITGPNMGGKSTFLRQNALIHILAQAGMFVPAKYAELGVIDKLFTRVGSADNLSNDQSTFMVEMMETAAIIKGATEKSLVIMDEIGRGTTPNDGISIGFACLNHLHNHSKCRTLFATHYYALSDMLKNFDSISCYCTRLHDSPDGSFVFDYRILPGVNRDSHALKTAQLAGLPQSVIDDARATLQELGQSSV